MNQLQVVLGYGPVGRALTEALVAAERPVRVVTRNTAAEVPGGVRVLKADVADARASRLACAGAGVVYGCVGLDYEDWPARWPPMMDGMLAGAEAAGARFVFMDNLYMYGTGIDGPLTEDLPLTDRGRKPATRAKLTRMWQAAHEAGRVRAVAVRASDFYGPHVTHAVLGEHTLGRIIEGKAAQCVGDVDQPHSYAFVPDVARALLTLAEADDDAYGQAWHVPNAPDRTTRELLELFAKTCKQPLKVRTLPRLLLTLLGLFDVNLRELKEMLPQWTRPYRVDHGKFAARFWDDPTPFEQGMLATWKWYRARDNE